MAATQKDPRGHTHFPILGTGCPRHRGAVGDSGIVIPSVWSWVCFAVVLASFKCKTHGRRIPHACKTHHGANLQQSRVGFEGLPLHPRIEGGAEGGVTRCCLGDGEMQTQSQDNLGFSRSFPLCSLPHWEGSFWKSPEHWTRGE